MQQTLSCAKRLLQHLLRCGKLQLESGFPEHLTHFLPTTPHSLCVFVVRPLSRSSAVTLVRSLPLRIIVSSEIGWRDPSAETAFKRKAAVTHLLKQSQVLRLQGAGLPERELISEQRKSLTLLMSQKRVGSVVTEVLPCYMYMQIV